MIDRGKPTLGPPVWWWSGLAASAAVAFGSEGYRSPLLLYIGASVAVAATRVLLMGPAKRPPTPAETETLDAIRVDLRTPFDEARHGDLLKRLWKAGLDGPFARRSTKWQLLGFQGEDPCTDLRACRLLGLKTLVTFLEKSPRYADAILSSRKIKGDFDPRAPGFYPVACAGIEVTAFLCESCGLRGPNGAPPPAELPPSHRWAALVGTRTSFDECFSAVMRALDRHFDDVGGDYMGFASVRDAVFADARDALDRGGPASTFERSLNLAPGAWGATKPDYAGYLDKLPASSRAKRLVAAWQRRYFVLRGAVIGVLKSDTAARAEACGELRSLYRLNAASVVSVRRDRLIIENLERDGRSKLKLVVRGDDLEKWAAALERAVPQNFSDSGDESPVVDLDTPN
jgi:hypothetical protein